MLNYKVYKHTNKINGKVYIGITKQQPERRWQKGKGYVGNDYFYSSIKKYGWENFIHEILYEKLSKEEAQKIEIELIKEYNSTNRNKGYNMSKGGETGSENLKIRKGKDNPNSRRIRQVDPKTNKIIKIFDSQSTAAEELCIKRKGITKNCRGKSKTYKGFIFEYDDCNFIKPQKNEPGKHNNHYKRKIKEIDKDGNTIKVFNSIKEAGEFYGIRPSRISQCLSKKTNNQTINQRRWCYFVNLD